ncbi:MAG: restriction endonuclease subunit S [Gammaproteobacteria bacterium]|nr:restriction endonuclease subunit S [Gammaproteobacteria bacterium]MBU1415202.1 restriction endonuclease subunit S [Gammaproteobacteria bacterium]
MTAVPLKSLCQIRHGGTPSKANAAYWDGPIPWVSPKDMKSVMLSDASDHISQEAVENSATSVVPEKSILVVVRSGILAHSLPVAQAAKPLAFNQDIKALTPDDAKVDPDYLFWFIRSQGPRVLAQGVKKGATVHSLQSGFIENLQVPLPTRPEQRRIVDLLSRAEGIVRLRREAEKKAAELIPALFLDMFGDPATNPKGLDQAPLGDLIRVKSGDFLPAEKMDASGSIPVYGGNGINGRHSSFLFSSQMIVIGRVGALCGNAHLTESPCWITDNALYVSDRYCHLNDYYLLYALRALRLNQYASQAAQPLISGSRIYPVKMLVPSEPAQVLFEDRAREMESIQLQQAAATIKAQATFDALLARAFSTEGVAA